MGSEGENTANEAPPLNAPVSSPFQHAGAGQADFRRPSPFPANRSRTQKSESSLRRASSGPQPRPKTQAPQRSSRLLDHALKPPVPPIKTSSVNKSLPQTSKAAAKPDKAKERLRTMSGTMKRTVSWNELHPQKEPAARREPSGGMAKQPSLPASKRLLHKLTHAPSGSAKVPIKLPVLTPMEIKILASVGERAWIKIDTKGGSEVFKRDKHVVTHELGIQIRDLRLLDPLMTSTYPSAILCREKALVVNLEYIKCIITRDSCLILDPDQAAVRIFVQQLQQKLQDSCAAQEKPHLMNGSALTQQAVSDLPYELRVLETALDNVSRHVESQYNDLDVAMRPMLGTHTASKVTSDYLERFRRLKTRMVRLKTRVETLKGVLDRILGDEGDMKAIHLTGRMKEQRAAVLRRLARRSLREGATPRQAADLSRMSKGSNAPHDERQEEEEREVAEVEMLLGAYYMTLDSTWDKLIDISEFVEDAEELMDLEMDTYRNNMIKVRVFFGVCHMLAGAMWAIANIFGMNVGLSYNDLSGETHTRFEQVVVGSVCSSVAIMVVFTGALHSKQLGITTVGK